METHATISGLLEKYFSDVPVALAFGNNDTEYHY